MTYRKFFASIVPMALLFALMLAPRAAMATDLSLDGNLRLQCSTQTASAGAATLNNKCGTITSESLTTAVGSAYVLTLTNSAIAAADIVLAEVANGTNTQGGATLQSVKPAAGSVVITIINNNTGTGASGTVQPLNGTLLIKYLTVKP